MWAGEIKDPDPKKVICLARCGPTTPPSPENKICTYTVLETIPQNSIYVQGQALLTISSVIKNKTKQTAQIASQK